MHFALLKYFTYNLFVSPSMDSELQAAHFVPAKVIRVCYSLARFCAKYVHLNLCGLGVPETF
jgi:hypothetical protein